MLENKANQLPQIQREKEFPVNEFTPEVHGSAWAAFFSEDEEGGRQSGSQHVEWDGAQQGGDAR